MGGKGSHLDTVQIARVAEGAVMLRLLARGFGVFGSPFDGDRADWVVEHPISRNIWKIQVKSAVQGRTGLPIVSLAHRPDQKGVRRYKDNEFDFIVGYNLFTDTAYVWSQKEVRHLAFAVTIHPDAEERWDKIGA